MGRLIDEQATNEGVRKVLRKYGFRDESVVSDEVWDTIENEVPTAYDVDKVVEQLEDACCKDIDGMELPIIGIEDAIEIVKGGGNP